MLEREKKQVLLLGLDNRTLWQLTRTLSLVEERLEFRHAEDIAGARALIEAKPVHLMVVEGWGFARQALDSFSESRTAGGEAGKWVVLVDSTHLDGLVKEGDASATVYFLEKPFDPKAFPYIILRLLEEELELTEENGLLEALGHETRLQAKGLTNHGPRDLSSFQNQKQGDGEPDAVDEAGPDTGPQPEEASQQETGTAAGQEFHMLLDKGFEYLRQKDWKGAKESWQKARAIRPGDKRLQVNLRRLDKIMNQ